MNRNNTNDGLLIVLLLLYTAASLLHFAHNAIYLHDYPNLPAWLTVAGVWWAWTAIASIGAAGFIALQVGWRHTALILFTVYAVLGFGGLDHYVVAPVTAHTVAMNFTIALEVAAALALLVYVGTLSMRGRGGDIRVSVSTIKGTEN